MLCIGGILWHQSGVCSVCLFACLLLEVALGWRKRNSYTLARRLLPPDHELDLTALAKDPAARVGYGTTGAQTHVQEVFATSARKVFPVDHPTKLMPTRIGMHIDFTNDVWQPSWVAGANMFQILPLPFVLLLLLAIFMQLRLIHHTLLAFTVLLLTQSTSCDKRSSWPNGARWIWGANSSASCCGRHGLWSSTCSAPPGNLAFHS